MHAPAARAARRQPNIRDCRAGTPRAARPAGLGTLLPDAHRRSAPNRPLRHRRHKTPARTALRAACPAAADAETPPPCRTPDPSALRHAVRASTGGPASRAARCAAAHPPHPPPRASPAVHKNMLRPSRRPLPAASPAGRAARPAPAIADTVCRAETDTAVLLPSCRPSPVSVVSSPNFGIFFFSITSIRRMKKKIFSFLEIHY